MAETTGEPATKKVKELGPKDVLRFAEAETDAVKGNPTAFAEHFLRMATFLMDRCTVHVGGVPHRLTEVEAYYRGHGHDDPYPHGDDLQKDTFCHWYFHRQAGKGYKSGSFKGLDITFGGPDAIGGFLIRGMASLAPPREFYDGPCICVDHILSLTKCDTINDLVAHEGTTDATRDGCSSGGTAVAPSGRKFYITLADAPHGVRVWKSPRVGLTLKGHSDLKDEFIMKNYRYLTDPRETKKGRQLVIAAMLQDGASCADVSNRTGSTKAACEKVATKLMEGKRLDSTAKFRDKQLGNDDTVALFGWAAAHRNI